METTTLDKALDEGRLAEAWELAKSDSDKAMVRAFLWSSRPTKQRRHSVFFKNGQATSAFDLKCPTCGNRVAWVSVKANGSLIYMEGPFRRFHIEGEKDRKPQSRITDATKDSPTEGQRLPKGSVSPGRVAVEHKCNNRGRIKWRTDLLKDATTMDLLVHAVRHNREYAVLP